MSTIQSVRSERAENMEQSVGITSNDSFDKQVYPPSRDRNDHRSDAYEHRTSDRAEDNNMMHHQHSSGVDEGVEVVLEDQGTKVVDDSPLSNRRPTPDQNVFRPPRPVRPRAVRAHHSGGPPHLPGSGSYGYGPPSHSASAGKSPHHHHHHHPPPPADYGHRPYPVPYNPSGSFDEGSYHHQSHYSPHIQYPPPGGMRAAEDINVISPNHKGDHGFRPPSSSKQRPSRGPPPPPPPPASHHHYQYPPTSPVSRPGTGHTQSPPRIKSYASREGPYSAAQRGRGSRHHESGPWNGYPPSDRPQPPLVTESSFDSDHYSSHHSHASHPNTPNPPHHGPPIRDPRRGFYGSGGGSGANGGSWGSFDSHAPPLPHFDDNRYYGHHHPQPDSPYSQYSYHAYSPGGGYYDTYSPYPPYHDYGRHPHSYEDDDPRMHKGYRGDYPGAVTPNDSKSNSASTGMTLPKAAQEVDFDVTDPPTEPVLQPSTTPVCDSPADVNSYDVLCGRGGGTNSQIGNRRFRKLVQEFQPTYLMARRKEKPLLARTIVLIIRKRGGRFLKKDEETGELYEVGDAKAEAKTSQALREGLDVRATKSTKSGSLLDKKKKKGKAAKTKDSEDDDDDDEEKSKENENEEGTEEKKSEEDDAKSKTEDDEATEQAAAAAAPTADEVESESAPLASPPRKEESDINDEKDTKPPHSPPTLPKLHGEEADNAGKVHPHSPEAIQFRKRRRMRSGEKGCMSAFQDKLFPDFCPPRADLGRPRSPYDDDHEVTRTPQRRNCRYEYDEDSIRYDENAQEQASRGCAGIALDIMTGAAAGSFCLGPRKWDS